MATKKYESMRIMSLEGSVLCKMKGLPLLRTESPIPMCSGAFSTKALIP